MIIWSLFLPLVDPSILRQGTASIRLFGGVDEKP